MLLSFRCASRIVVGALYGECEQPTATWLEIPPQCFLRKVEMVQWPERNTPTPSARLPAHETLSNLERMSSKLLIVNAQTRAAVGGLCGKGKEPTTNSAGSKQK